MDSRLVVCYPYQPLKVKRVAESMLQEKNICSLRANVSREEASRHFTGGLRGVAAGFIRGRARSIADLYIPYRLFRVKISNRGREEIRIFALDAVEGALDLFEFPGLPGESEVVALKTRNVLPCRLAPEQMQQLIMNQVRRLVFSRGFLRLQDLQMEATAIAGEVYLPYWVCFRGNAQVARLEVLDAVRRKPEGGKVRGLVQDWLRGDSARDEGVGGE
jgi:hypothetical protein